MKLPIQNECIIFRRDSNKIEFLLLKRTPERGGFWQPITGGYEDADGTLIDSCFREIKEETGIEKNKIINIYKNIYFFQYNFNDLIISEYVFGFETSPAVKINLEKNIYPEHTEYRWVNFNEAMSLLKWDTNKEAFKILFKLAKS